MTFYNRCCFFFTSETSRTNIVGVPASENFFPITRNNRKALRAFFSLHLFGLLWRLLLLKMKNHQFSPRRPLPSGGGGIGVPQRHAKVVFLAFNLMQFFLTLIEGWIVFPKTSIMAKKPEDRLPLTKPMPFGVLIQSNFLNPNNFPVGIFFSDHFPKVCL